MLPTRGGDAARLLHPLHCVQIRLRRGLLEPVEVEAPQFLSDGERPPGREATVTVDQEIHVRANGLSHGLHAVNSVPRTRGIVDGSRKPVKWRQLYGVKSFSDGRGRISGEPGWCPIGCGPVDVGVEPDLIPTGAAE